MSRPQTPAYAVRRPPIINNSGSGQSRSSTPLAKTVISLDEWESKSPLTDEQLDSINVVKEKLSNRPYPEKFAIADNAGETSAQGAARSFPVAPRPARISDLLPASPSSRRSMSPSGASVASATPRSPGSPAQGTGGLGASTSSLHLLDPIHPHSIVTPQQFHDHFAALTLYTEHEQDSLYRDHLSEVTGLKERCDSLIEDLRSSEVEVGEMLKALGYVEERSESLRGACEDLLEEQTHLLTHTSQLAHRLTFFTFLESAQRTLNSPDPELVLSEAFLPMVKRLDECLGYLGEHRDFKDSELYLIRYQQCMTRSMALVKIYFVNSVRSLGQEITKRISDQSLGETALQALLYTKFITLSAALRPLIAELERRVNASPDDLNSLLAECHAAWVSTRQTLMGPRVSAEVVGMNPDQGDLLELTRGGCSYVKSVCQDEFSLFKHFFLSGESQLYGYLESLCDYLYDHLRPRILHEPSLEVLCGVCTVIQALMVQDITTLPALDDPDEVLYTPRSTPGSPFTPGESGDYFSNIDETFSDRQRRTGSVAGYNGSLITRNDDMSMMTKRETRKRIPLRRLHLEVLLRMVLQDAQTRLVFRAQAMLRSDVEYYVPKEGDLAYPNKVKNLIGGPTPKRQMSISLDPDDDDEPAFLSLPPVSVQESWYPTLRATLWILSCLYSYVENSVFEDLAQEAVVNCRRSLSTASDHLSAKKGDTVKSDSKLFLVRHLLILKEMTAGLELGRSGRARDWQGITDFLRVLLDNASTMLGYARGSVIRPGQVVPDAKTDIDQTLKIACEDLIQICTIEATAPLTAFIDKATSYLTTRPGNSSDLPSQAFAKPEEVMKVHNQFKSNVKNSLQSWKERLELYLQDRDTVEVLIPPAQNSIVDGYRRFHDLIRSEYDFATAANVMTPSAVHNLLID